MPSLIADFAKKWEKFYHVFAESGGYREVLLGLRNTLLIAVLGLLIGILIGTLIAAVKVLPRYKRVTRFFQKVCDVYVAFFRGTPMVVQLLLGYYVLFPLLGISLPVLEVCIIVFGLNSGAYVSEIMRGGIQSVDPGQMEAGRALGLSFSVTMGKVVIPQAVKNILPTLGNEFITLIKETSIVNFIGATDLCVAFRYIGTNNYEFMVPYLVMAVIYIVLVLLITWGIRTMERRMKRSDRV
ncbi:MAG: amino acid ABC transporter permease [Candidatus Methanomethylophilaceae archaeon]|nr:amino acid ABC transporter permease [Candidatus Methanomethylophilaceae archaeon]